MRQAISSNSSGIVFKRLVLGHSSEKKIDMRLPLLVISAAIVACLLARATDAQPFHPCDVAGSCCFDLSFGSEPGTEGAALSQGYVLAPQLYASSPWGNGSLGLTIGVSTAQPGAAGWTYPLALLDPTSVMAWQEWRDLRSPSAGLVAVVASSSSPLQPLRGQSVVWVNFTSQAGGACLRSVSLMRTWSLAYRQGAALTLYDNWGAAIDMQSFPWSLQVQSNWVNVSYAASGVRALRIDFAGVGYGAFAGLSACYPNTAPDACGICGGAGMRCKAGTAGPKVGEACFNDSMSNPVCRPGTYVAPIGAPPGAPLWCRPAQYMLAKELCDGIDNDVRTAPSPRPARAQRLVFFFCPSVRRSDRQRRPGRLEDVRRRCLPAHGVGLRRGGQRHLDAVQLVVHTWPAATRALQWHRRRRAPL